jgi:hypothetical protein
MSPEEQTGGPAEDFDGKSAAPASQHVVDVETSGLRARPPRARTAFNLSKRHKSSLSPGRRAIRRRSSSIHAVLDGRPQTGAGAGRARRAVVMQNVVIDAGPCL